MKITNSALFTALFALSLFPCAGRLSAEERQTLNTRASQAATGLRRIERLPAADRLRVAIGLPLRNRGTLTHLIQQQYTPGGAKFHHYLTPAQFAEQFGPTGQDYQKVVDFAKVNGMKVEGTFGNRALLEVSGTVADLEKAFHVTLGVYQHPTENRRFYGPDVEPTVDASLPILYVSGLDNYVIPHPNSQPAVPCGGGVTANTNNGSGSSGTYLGYDFRNAYVPGTQLTGAGQCVGLVEFDGYTYSDIQKYESLAQLPDVPLQNVLLTGASGVPGTGNGEVALDIEMVIAMAPGLSQVNVYEGTSDVEILNEIASPTQGEPLPAQVSCSWGIGGDINIESDLLELAAQGQSFFYAAGDTGAYPTSSNDGNVVQTFMTVCGGSELSMNGTGVSWLSDTVWHPSSGGILINVPIPYYQQSVNMSFNQGSSQWRNVPDVSMCGDQIEVIDTAVYTNGNPSIPGQVADLAGTSAAAPLWAGLTALVNQQTAAQGQPPVGFVTPALYEIAQSPLYGSCFHDVTIGNNTNADSPSLYYATNGYDLCSGWGTPAGASLINALTSLTGPVFVNFNYVGFVATGSYSAPFNTLAGGVDAVSVGGTIFIETAGSSSETFTISKPMTITAEDGPATVGQ